MAMAQHPEERRWTIRKATTAPVPFDSVFASIIGPNTEPVEVVPAVALAASVSLAAEYERIFREESDRLALAAERLASALNVFMERAEKWAHENSHGWEDDTDPDDHAMGWEPQWYAEMEVCNRDILMARAALEAYSGDST